MRISDWSSDVCSSDLFEADRNAAALACYHDDARRLETVVRAFFSEAGVGISREAVALLACPLGGDRDLTPPALEKVMQFAAGRQVALAAVAACVVVSALISLAAGVFPTAGGHLPGTH